MCVKIGLLCTILAGAAWTDFSTGKIKNWWLFVGAAAGILCRGRDFFPGAAIVLFLTFLLYRIGMLGAGDGKLMALITGYLGTDAGTEAIFTGMLIGAIWSLYHLRRTKKQKNRLLYLAAYFLRIIQTGKIENYCELSSEKGDHTLPLAVCMAAGTYLYLLSAGFYSLWRSNSFHLPIL